MENEVCLQWNGSVNKFLFSHVMALFFAVCLMPALESKVNKRRGTMENVSVEIVLIVFMIVGFIVELLFVIFRNRVAVIHSSKLFQGVDRIMYAMGLIVFYMSGVILDLFHVIAKVSCDQVWRSCDDKIHKAYVIDVVFNLAKVTYLGGFVVFTLVFYSSKFLNTCLARYGLMFLLSTYLAIWFDLFVYQSRHILRTEQETRQSKNLTTYCSTTTNNSSNVSEIVSNLTLHWQCIHHATPTYRMREDYIVPICYPIAFQTFILIIERFLHWFPDSRSGEENDLTRISDKEDKNEEGQLNKHCPADRWPWKWRRWRRTITILSRFWTRQ